MKTIKISKISSFLFLILFSILGFLGLFIVNENLTNYIVSIQLLTITMFLISIGFIQKSLDKKMRDYERTRNLYKEQANRIIPAKEEVSHLEKQKMQIEELKKGLEKVSNFIKKHNIDLEFDNKIG